MKTLGQQHLISPATKNATYLSPTTQNQILNILGQDIILNSLISEVQEAGFYAVMADEVTSHNREVLALCVRFVDSNLNIREEFIDFIHVQRITGEYLANTILHSLKQLGLDPANICGQGYDGASNMSSDNVGVQKRIREEAPIASYVHCSGHCLNLVIAHSCHHPNIHNMLDCLKKCNRFFLSSPKRNGLLELIVAAKVVDTGTYYLRYFKTVFIIASFITQANARL
jgi:hypothetical protein